MEVTDEIIDQMVDVIVKEVSPEKVVLFGSRAAGNAASGSDVDFLVVESGRFGKDRSRRQEMARLWWALAIFPVPKDILVYSAEEVERWRSSLNHVVARALREGKVVYERP